MRILILGGTEEARLLADALVDRGHEITLSYAGRTTEPVPPRSHVRVGGFGGPAGLSDYINANGIERLVDATHPYSVQIASNAVAAAEAPGVPRVRLSRPGRAGRSRNTRSGTMSPRSRRRRRACQPAPGCC